jgi:hypothetical protein
MSREKFRRDYLKTLRGLEETGFADLVADLGIGGRLDQTFYQFRQLVRNVVDGAEGGFPAIIAFGAAHPEYEHSVAKRVFIDARLAGRAKIEND